MAEQTKAVDVVAALELQAYRFRSARLTRELRDCSARELLEARAAIAELVAADVEYDEACEALTAAEVAFGNWRRPIDGFPEEARVQAALERRTAALAAVRGGAQ